MNIALAPIFLVLAVAIWVKLYSIIAIAIHLILVSFGTILFFYQRTLEFNIDGVKEECLSAEIYNRNTGELKKFIQTDKWQNKSGKKILYKFEDRFLYFFKKFIIFPIIFIGPVLTGIILSIGKIGNHNQRDAFISYGALFVYYILLYVLFPKYAAYLVYSREEKRTGRPIYFTDIKILKAELENLNR
ncbi:hypothetical protein KJ966_03710 [bacterium]|nr:hypothetical protein [bacterium]